MIKKGRAAISALLAILILFSMVVPHNAELAYGYDKDTYAVSEIVIGKEHDSNRLTTGMSLSIKGSELEGAPVFIEYGSKFEQLKGPKINTYGLLYFEFTKPEDWEKLKNIKSIVVGNASIPIGDKGAMPTITDVTPKVNKDMGTLYIKGTNFDLITDTAEITVKYGTGVLFNTIPNDCFKTNPAQINEFQEGELGLQDIEITRKFDTDPIKFNDLNSGKKVKITINHTYNGQFRLVEDLNISTDIEMFPNRGAKGGKVYFKASQLRQYDVYFLKATDGTDPYTTANKGKNPSPLQQTDDGKYVFTVEVPDITPGEYWVVLTNQVPDYKDPMQAVSGEYIYQKEKFTVIQGSKSAKIDIIQPNKGPDTGSTATITGRYLGSLNIDDLQIDENCLPNIDILSDGVMKLTYKSSDNAAVGTYRNLPVTTVEKTIKVIIGPQADVIKEGSTFSPDIDKLAVKINADTNESNPVKDVVVETTTRIVIGSNEKEYLFTERAELPKGYTFIPSRIKPEANSIVPGEIHVTKKNDGTYVIPQDLMIGIYGKNFAIYKYTVDGAIKAVYPIISFGDVKINKNENSNIQLYVMDDAGNIMDGSTGQEAGTRILLTIPKDTKIPEEYVNTNVPVVVTNPVRNSDVPGLSSESSLMVKFILSKDDKTPVIESVVPDVVTVSGGETVTIKGSNFLQDVKVFIDGKEVSSIRREGDGKTITFKAPPGREGTTQLQVINPGGGIAVKEFNYVKTYTDPKITDFAPKVGNTGTLVLVTGDNFLAPDPTSTGTTTSEIYKLIGTRILLQNQDINEYNTDPETKRITLQYYASPENDEILSIGETVDGRKYLKIADYWHSIVFKDSQDKFYTLKQDFQGNAILSDGVKNTYTIGIKYDDTSNDYALMASKEGGSDYKIEIDTVNEIINGKDVKVTTLLIKENPSIKLYMQTLYKVDDSGVIVGNNVKVIDKNKIIFKVPKLSAGDGYYDLTVLNPDTKRDSRTGTQGFYYYTQPQSRPKIVKIVPDKGSTDGGYTVDIIGEDFKDDGTYKSKVFINGVEVKKEDTIVSVDGKTITVKVPPFSGDLSKEKGTDRITVPVVVLNPDGASAGKEDGFTYMVPTSYPRITRVVPSQGSAAGKQIVEITGSDFRYFEPYNDDNRNQIKDENEIYQDLNGNGIWDDFRPSAVKERLGNSFDENKDIIQNLKDYYGENFDKIVLSVLPKIYFGNQTAEIVEFADGYLKVKTPAASAGTVDVYIVNNDSGISNKVKYTYTSTKPVITRIVPSEGKKQGGDRVEVFGSGFAQSDMRIVDADGAVNLKQMAAIRFGNITNRNIPREEENSGRIDNQRTTVNLAGGLRVEYANGKIYLTLSEGGREFVTLNPIPFDGNAMFVSTRLLKAEGTNPYPYSELIRLEISDRRLFVERGYAPEVEFLNSGQLVVTTPAYYTIGQVEVTLINPDGGTAQSTFMYKYPASSPYIVNLTKEGKSPEDANINGRDIKVLYLTYKGGNTVSVIGGDFRENAKIQISDVATIEPKDITYTLPTKLTFTMPQVPESAVGKLHRLVVINEDGGQAASDKVSPKPIYIMFVKGETSPAITKITPDKGPSSGGTSVKIEGKDFREGLKVYFGETPVPEDNIQVIDYKTILAVTPPHASGTVDVKVENPDGELSAPSGKFTYLSTPKISAVVDPTDPSETTKITRISINGGQRIKIKGTGFMTGARVIFAPSLKKIDSESDASGTIVYVDGIPYLLENGIDGTGVNVIDSQTITVITAPAKLDSKGVLVINPDGGATDIYEQLTYGLPELSAPMNVTAELVYDRYIKISWSAVESAKGYEIYAVVDDNNIDFVGNTELTSFVYSDLEPYTMYKFVVKALGDFGSSPPSAESNTVRTGGRVGPSDEDGGLVEETTTEKIGNTVRIVIGTKDYRKDITVNLVDSNFLGANTVTITMPVEIISKSNSGDITILGKDFTLKFNPKAFYTSKVRQYEDKDNTGVRFEITYGTESTGFGNRTLLSGQLLMKAGLYVGSDTFDLDYLNDSMQFGVDFDRAKANLRKITNIALYRYDDAKGDWTSIYERYSGPDVSVKTTINRLGKYAVFGTRG
ncbi:IPT/TIG domain-containing protein [Tepidanaerobacter syntrophicus]|uniref:IPT/TIG domain-containing protein n=1 Tax=Tepidanaerobacter syntrophicus TaxID=224999 RepID=A0A0U9I5B7_9FIRM|nr:IPT/TIG domain-containing protein [Tepidanaerobacter syntrophicus]GAQ25736.1 IPT/TIG domain-containing protein [Tepidanaerobacter syntrophicus]